MPTDLTKTKKELVAELEALRRRVAELEAGPDHGSGQVVEARKANGDLPGTGAPRDAAELTQGWEAIRKREAFIQAVMDNLPIGIAVNSVDPTVTFEYMNENFPSFYRTSREALKKQNTFWEAVYEDAEFREEIKKRVLDDCASGDPERMYWVDVPIARSGEETSFITARNTPVPDKGIMISTVWDVTERKQAEVALRESEELFRQLAENIQEVFWLGSANWEEVLYVSPAYEVVWGRSRQSLYDAPFSWMESLPDEDRERIVEYMSGLQGSGLEAGVFPEYRVVRDDGSVRWIRARYFPVQDEEGTPCRVAGIAEDITERKKVEEELADHWDHLEDMVREKTHSLTLALEQQEKEIAERKRAEEALRENQARLQLALDSAQAGVWIWDIQSNRVFWDQRMQEVFGLAPGTFDGTYEAWKGRVHPDDVEDADRSTRKALESGVPYSFEYRVKGADGDWKNVHACAVVIQDDQGNPLRMAGMCRDITERKRVEEALQEASAFNKAILSHASVGLGVYNAESGDCLMGNETMAGLVGGTLEQVQSQNFRRIASWKASGLLALAEEAISSGVTQRTEIQVGTTFGKDVLLECILSAFSLSKRYLLLITSDISGKVQAEQSLIAAKNAAEAANRSKSEFLANMSHEIRTPLNGVMGLLQLLDTDPLSERQEENVALALTASGGLLTLIDDILDLSKVEAEKMEIVEMPFQPSDILRSVAGLLKVQAMKKSLELDFFVETDVPDFLYGDAARIRQVLFNLAGNAVKFSEQGEVRIHLSTEQGKDEENNILLHCSVSDTGIGIPQEKLEFIFEPFSQVEGSYSRRFPGTGLGLAIVKRLVAMMGGELSVESELGKGSTFQFFVKLKEARSEVEKEPVGSEQSEITDGHALTILVVDDESLNRKVVCQMLQRLGHTAKCVLSGPEALASLKQHRFDLVLMDVQMPEMDGIETMKRIRDGDSGLNAPDMPIVALTAFTMKGDRERFLEAGMDDYISKPIAMKDVKKALARAVLK